MTDLYFRSHYCSRCDSDTSHIVTPRESGPHYAQAMCRICGTKHWASKPKNKNKRKSNKYTPEDLGLCYCLMCLRDRSDLINSETLESHHIIQISHGGEDVPENIWILCTPCHKLVHHNRTYLRRASGDYI